MIISKNKITNANDSINLLLPGTEYGPKCINIPILASSYQEGSGLESKLVQFGS